MSNQNCGASKGKDVVLFKTKLFLKKAKWPKI